MSTFFIFLYVKGKIMNDLKEKRKNVINLLKRYQILKISLDEKNKTLNELYSLLNSFKNKLKMFPQNEFTELFIKNYLDLINITNEEISKTNKTMLRVFELLSNIDVETSDIIYMHYIRGISWVSMSMKLNLSERQLQRIAYKGIEKLTNYI